MLKRKSAILVLSLVLALSLFAGVALLSLLSNDNHFSVSSPDASANAAISPATSFGRFPNGTKYYYTNATSTTEATITVNSSATYGSQTNPFVIRNKEEWVFFANMITAQNSTYAGAKHFVLGADIDLGGNSVSPVGCHATGFQGFLYGNKHTIKNGTLAANTTVNSSQAVVGLFYKLNGASVFDLTIASNIVCSVAANKPTVIGTLAGFATNTTLVNVHSSANLTVNNSASTVGTNYVYMGGLLGQATGGSYLKMYKCSHQGTFTETAGADSVAATSYTDNAINIGGLLGRKEAAVVELTVLQCVSKMIVNGKHGGINLGVLFGGGYIGNNLKVTIQNYVSVSSYSYSGNMQSPDIRNLNGYTTAGTCDPSSLISNIYLYNDGANASVNAFLLGSGNVDALEVSQQSGVYTNKSLTLASTAGKVTTSSSAADLVTKANANSSVNTIYTLSTAGAPTAKAASTGRITFAKGDGATGGAADTTYTVSTADQTKSGTAPTRTGYTFKGWSLVSPTGTISNTTTITNFTIPKNTTGNITVYAVWQIQALNGTAPSASTITYGSDGTFDASKVSHPAGTSNANYGVNLSYQWQTSAGANISGATASTYKLTKPAAGTHTYKVVVTATPKDGITAGTSNTYTVSLTVNMQGVTVPTATSGLIYNNSSQTGVSSSSTLFTLSGNTGTNAGSYTATATLKDKANYCWGSSTTKDKGVTADQKITWSIGKASVAAPTITAGATLTYNGAYQKPTTSSNTQYSVTHANSNQGGMNVGTYNVEFNLKDGTNYKWSSITGSKVTTTESGKYTLQFSITKASVTLTAPSYTSSGVGGKTYVGQTLANLTLNQSSGTHVRAGSSVDVPGTWSWNTASNPTTTKIVATSTTFVALFTPTDSTNYSTATVNVSVGTPVQLYLRVRELGIEFLDKDGAVVDFKAGTNPNGTTFGADVGKADKARTIVNARLVNREPVSIPVDYNSTFAVANLKVNNGDKVNGVAVPWQYPTGYDFAVYKAAGANNVGQQAFAAGASTDAITADLTIYVGYVAKTVNYTVITVKQALDGNHATPTNADILGNTTDEEFLKCIKTTTLTATAGTKVNFPSDPVTGFTRKNSLESETLDNGKIRTFVSDDQGKFVVGTGDTILITYYERNTYTVTWNFNNGTSTNMSDDGPITSVNRLAYTLKYEAPFIKIADPEIPGYFFDNWYTDQAYTTLATIPSKMGNANLTFYAGRRSVEYKLEFFFGLESLASDLGFLGSALPQGYEESLNFSKSDLDQTYTVEQINASGSIRLKTPTMTGFKFDGWEYTDETGAKHKISVITRTTAANYELYATWVATTYTVSLNSNGGNRVSPSSVKLTNLMTFNDPKQAKNIFDIEPTRAGYTFDGWAYREGTAYTTINSGDDYYNYLRHGTTLYAMWVANPVVIDYTDEVYDKWNGLFEIAITSTDAVDENGDPDPTRVFTPEDTVNYDLLYKDSVLTIDITPVDGYEVSTISISGVSFTNHGRYTVRTYDNDTMFINIELVEKRYSVTYMFDGGSYEGTAEYPRSFVLSTDDFKLITGRYVTKLGYTFLGWEYKGELQGYDIGDPDYLEVNCADWGANNVTLRAKWQAAPVVIEYRNNYVDGSSENNRTEKVYSDDNPDIVTGSALSLWQPALDSGMPNFIPANRELIGWATSPNGDIEYSVNYKYIVEGGESRFEPQDVPYTVKAVRPNSEGKLVNTLYAVWRMTNVQYLTIEALNNNTTYSDDASYQGVSLTARPRYTYTKDSSLNLVFEWYKVDPTTWERWTEDDLEGLEGDARNQALSNVEMRMYKIPANAKPVTGGVSETLTNVGAEGQLHTLANIKNVKDAGLYLCKLTAQGTYTNAAGGIMTSKIDMYGQYEVSINKATLNPFTLDTPANAFVYNGNAQGIKVGTNYSVDANGAYRLPDGSLLKVKYLYTVGEMLNEDDENQVRYEDGVVNVGEYYVAAKFEFVKEKDNGNYVLPSTLYAECTVDQLEINQVTYVLQTQIDGEWEIVSASSNIYTGNPFRVVATAAGANKVINGDDVTIVMFYDGDMAEGALYAQNVGTYVAYCQSLDGEDSANYKLSSSIDGYDFEITKATHQISVTFEDAKVTYDGDPHSLTISKIIENGDVANPVEIGTTNRPYIDTITLKDGCTINLIYDFDSVSYVDSRFAATNPARNSNRRGGVNAGEYVIKVTFEEDDESNEVNYEAIDDMTATLTIEQAPYNGGKGLTDDQLNRYVKDSAGNVVLDDDNKPVLNNNGFGDRHVVNFNADDGYYNPALVMDNNFKVDYRVVFTGDLGDGQGSRTTVIDETNKSYVYKTSDDGLYTGYNKAGLYEFTATITYLNLNYANNYSSIPDQVVELKILQGVIDHLDISYNQTEHEKNRFGGVIEYGETFDFYDASLSGYVVGITAVYANNGGTERIDNYQARFLNEAGDDFEIFDRATVKRDGTTAISEDIDTEYKITVEVYGQSKEFGIRVRQGVLGYSDVNFADDENLHRVSGEWIYNTEYDGQSHYPALDGADNGYNFTGIETDTIAVGTDITAKYEYSTDNGTTWTDMPAAGLKNAAKYKLRVTFTNKNTNYADLDVDKTRLFCTQTISQKTLTSSDITWQYAKNDTFTGSQTLPANANLEYYGGNGFYVKAVYRNLDPTTNGAKPYFEISEIVLKKGTAQSTTTDTSVIHIKNAGEYTVTVPMTGSNTLDANYKLTGAIDANITIDACPVTITWGLKNNVTSLEYNGVDQFDNVTANYKAPATSGDSDGGTDIDDAKVTLEVVTEGTDKSFANAGTYTLKAVLANKNYTAKDGTGIYTVTIDPLAVTESNTTITWWYVDGAGSHKITDADLALTYIANDIKVYVTYSLKGDDASSTGSDIVAIDGTASRYAEALDATGHTPHNAGDYELTAGVQGNYDLSGVVYNLTIEKREITIDWLDKDTSYTYNGLEQAFKAKITDNQVVGLDAANVGDIVTFSGDKQRNANDKYTVYATVVGEYVDNYKIVGDASCDWSISKLVINVEWDVDNIVYNHGYDLNNWSGTVANVQNNEDGNPDIVDLTFTIFRGENRVNAMTTAGDYKLMIVGINNDNYSFDGIGERTVTVKKATPFVHDVVYKEYADNTTYQNNNKGLRDSKLEYVCDIDGVEVPGTLKFKEGYSLATTGPQIFPCEFTPADTDNYETVVYNNLRLTVQADTITRLGVDREKIATVFAVGTGFSKFTVDVYYEYASYYVEDGVAYGERTPIDMDTQKVSFVYNGAEIVDDGYTFDANDIGEDRVIYISTVYRAPGSTTGSTKRGEIHIRVIDAIPTKMTIFNKEELQNAKYYVGSTFDKSLIQAYVNFKSGSDGFVDPSQLDIANATLPDDEGYYTIEVTYFTNTEFQQKDTIRIYVSLKETVKIGFTDRTLRFINAPIELPPVLCEDGSALPEGIDYRVSITDSNGNPVSMEAIGDYIVTLKFTVDTSKYNPINDIRVTISVRDIKAVIVESLLVKPNESRPYTGNIITSKEYELANIHFEDSEDPNKSYTLETINYTINGKAAENVTIQEANTYAIVANIAVRSVETGEVFTIEPYTYQIVVEKVVNVIDTFVINNWIEGNTPGLKTFNCTYGIDTETYEYYRITDSGKEELIGSELPTTRGKYVAVVTVHGTRSYDEVSERAYFTVTKAMLNPAKDATGESLKSEDGKDKVQVTTSNGVDPTYNLRVEVLKDTSDITIKKQVVLVGYDIDIVDASNNVVANPGEYTVRLLLTAEQRANKNIKVYSVDEYGASTEITGSKVDEDGYLVFKTSNFSGNFVIGARDAAAASRLGWIIGVSVGAVVAICAVIALIVVIVKKKKEND